MVKTTGKKHRIAKSKAAISARWSHIRTIRSTPITCRPTCTSTTPQSCKIKKVTTAQPQTASVRKLNIEENMSSVEVNPGNDEYIFMHMQSLCALFSNVLCSECNNKTVSLQTRKKHGFSTQLIVKCEFCDVVLCDTYSSPKITNNKPRGKAPFDVNRKIVQAFTSFGKGHAALEHFSLSMNTNVMCSATYYAHMCNISKDVIPFACKILENARQKVKREHYKESPDITGQAIINIAVSYDGTWQKRGHTSNYGIGCVVDILTGLVIDFEILSKYCHVCSLSERQLGRESPEFFFWFEGHKAQCQRNYSGSSPAMEMEAGERLWRRSEKLGFRYTILLSDGDSKTFNHLEKLKIYGDEFPITKEECINHISKRLGTGLRNEVKKCKAKNITLGGKTYGSLKETTIVKLTQYYRSAIVNNIPNIADMKKAVFATLSHCKSTDAKPQHGKCPQGETSWCFYNQSIAKGEKPKPHKEMIHTPISEMCTAKILPVYQRLSSDSLLARCTQGKTQNANECLHSVIWSKCSKENFVSKKKIHLAVVEAVAQFNQGSYKTELDRTPQGTPLSGVKQKICKKIDHRRLKQSVRRSLQMQKITRQADRVAKIHKESLLQQREGKTYGSGEF